MVATAAMSVVVTGEQHCQQSRVANQTQHNNLAGGGGTCAPQGNIGEETNQNQHKC